MTIRILTCLMAVSFGTFAQAQLGPAQRFAQHFGAVSPITTGDIDNDGLDEIFLDKLMMKQTSPGHYSSLEVVVTTPDPIAQIMLADMDGDGWRDLVLRTSELLWEQNLGGTSFGPVQTLATPGWPSFGCELADLDGDLDLDALLWHNTPVELHWMENLGGGGFGAPASIYTGVCTNIRVADLDGDLDVDIVFTLNNAQNLIWLENDGSASFTQHMINTAGVSYYALCVADMDGDLDNDLVVADEYLGVDLLENLSPGTFAAAIPTGIQGAGPYYTYQGLTAVDREGDGDRDLCYSVVGSTCYPAFIRWEYNTGGGSMSGGFGYFADDGVTADGLYFTTGQLDADIGIDLLWGDDDGLRVDASNLTSHSCASIKALDGDQDGDADVVIGSVESVAICQDAKELLAFHENTGSTGMELWPQQQFPTVYSVLWSLGAADLDGDLNEDLLVTHSWGDDIQRFFWMKNMGGGQFDSIASFGTGYMVAITLPLAGDVDNDGDRDVITPSNETLFLHRNTGSWSFDPPVAAVATWNAVSTMGLVDLDNDGDLDYLWTNLGLWWSANDGTGIGGPPQSIDASINYQSLNVNSNIITVDLDLDNDSDLVVPVASFTDYSVAVLLNNGGGSFAPTALFPLSGFFEFKVADMTGDGYPDLIAPADGSFHLLQNQGDGTFSGWQVLTTPAPIPGVGDMDVADIDGDGRLDVLVASGYSATWYKNLLAGIPLALPQQSSSTLSVLPNPMVAQAILMFGDIVDPSTRILLEDLQGRVVREMAGNNSREMIIDRGDVPSGMYLVRVVNSHQICAARLIME